MSVEVEHKYIFVLTFYLERTEIHMQSGEGAPRSPQQRPGTLMVTPVNTKVFKSHKTQVGQSCPERLFLFPTIEE